MGDEMEHAKEKKDGKHGEPVDCTSWITLVDDQMNSDAKAGHSSGKVEDKCRQDADL